MSPTKVTFTLFSFVQKLLVEIFSKLTKTILSINHIQLQN